MLLNLQLDQLGTQLLHTVVLVLELGTLLLRGYHDAGGLVDQADGGGGLVDVLAACAGGAVDLHLNVLRPDLHFFVVRQLRHDLHSGKAGLAAGVGIKGGDADQPVDAVLAFQQAVGVFALDGNNGGFDARLVAFFIVQGLPGKAVALRPAGVHTVEHLAPVLGLGAAGAGMKLKNDVVGVVLPGEEGGHPDLFDAGFQDVELGFQFLQNFGVLRLLAHFAQGGQVLPGAHELLEAVELVLQLLETGLHLLRALQVVPEAVLGGLILQPGSLLGNGVDVQGVSQLLQFRFQIPQLLLISVIFDQSHISLSIFHTYYFSHDII